MTDKVELIKNEIERLRNVELGHGADVGKNTALTLLSVYISSITKDTVIESMNDAIEDAMPEADFRVHDVGSIEYAYSSDNMHNMFKAGAKWQKEKDDRIVDKADKVYADICEKVRKSDVDKACEWLYKQLNEGDMECGDMERFIEDFRKAMD